MTASDKQSTENAGTSRRRSELLGIAAVMFAKNGLRATTVRDIADAAGILSGSLYHHFDSKESIVDELLRDFLDDLFDQYHSIVNEKLSARKTLEKLITASFDAIDQRHAQVAIYQDEAKRLVTQQRFSYISDRNIEFRQLWVQALQSGINDGSFRPDLDVELVYRFIRDTVWVAVRWYQPGGVLTSTAVAQQYLSIVLDGITTQ
ncbi:MAG: TetR/AcrR family transcriptional regulator [Mycobacteriaceae bacterium]